MNPSEASSLLPGLPQGAEILIIRLRSLGDVVLLTPAISALHQWRRDLRISVLVEPAWAAVLEGNPAVHETIIARSFIQAAREIRSRKFPIVFNQHGGPSSAFLTAATGAKARVCWKGRQFGFLYNVHAPDATEFYGTLQVHTIEQRMTQFYWTGLPRGPIPPAFVYPQPDARARIAERFWHSGLDVEQQYAVIQPGARYFTKRWAIDKFAALARWLEDSRGLVSLVILGPDERAMPDAAQREFPPGTVILNSLDLRETIALIAGAKLFIGNDSGPAHLSAALNIPSAVIFGSSSSVHWQPWQGSENPGTRHRVVQNNFPCNPCRGDRCYAFDEPRCILSVTVEQVREACEALL